MLLEGLDSVVLKKLALSESTAPDLSQWNTFLQRHKNPKHRVRIGLVGKYVELPDAYKSILEAFIHAGAANEVKVDITMIHSEYLEENNIQEKFNGLDGVLVAPGFGERGIEGKIKAVQYVREQNIPFLGICLGMQMAVIEFARHVAGFENANTAEVNPNALYKVIDLMEEQKHITQKGGTMRLGAWDCSLSKDSKIYQVYGEEHISERHRHRYEFNNEYKKPLEESGLLCTGINPNTGLVEVIELPEHRWFIGVQYHPEYKSTVARPHPLFVAFVQAALKYKLEK
jgi:CTP synthase